MARTPYELNVLAQHYRQAVSPALLKELADEEDMIVNLSALDDVYVSYLLELLAREEATTDSADERLICRKLQSFIWSVRNFFCEGVDAPWHLAYTPPPSTVSEAER